MHNLAFHRLYRLSAEVCTQAPQPCYFGDYKPAGQSCAGAAFAAQPAPEVSAQEVSAQEEPAAVEAEEENCIAEEYILKNGDQDIYGVLYTPMTADSEKLPVVILSHGFGGTADMFKSLAQNFAENGRKKQISNQHRKELRKGTTQNHE